MTATARKHSPAKAAPRSAAEDVLAHAQAGRAVIQDFVPLADSLKWDA